MLHCYFIALHVTLVGDVLVLFILWYFVTLLHCRWLDKLGLSASMGVGVVMRQEFVGGNYALVSEDLDPNPVSCSKFKFSELIKIQKSSKIQITQDNPNSNHLSNGKSKSRKLSQIQIT